MTRLSTIMERTARTAPAQCFNGGQVGHGKLLPMPKPSILERLFRKGVRHG